MNTIPSPYKGDPKNDQASEQGIEESIPPNHHEINITEGGEFLDDAIRLEDDQPIEETVKKPSKKNPYQHLF